MLVLFETPAGFGLFRIGDDKLEDVSKLHKRFATPEQARETVTLQAFGRFRDTAEALAATTALVEGKLGKGLKKFLKANIVKKGLKEELAVMDAKVGNVIKEKLGVACVSDSRVLELTRCIRSQLSHLIEGLEERQLRAMMLGLGHSLSRYKLKFSADKVDTMIVQAIGLLDELDKEINTYAMRVKEWFGWHFPEMAKVVQDNLQYAQVIMKMGMRPNAATTDMSDILSDDVEAQLKETAVISMGTDITEVDLATIRMLCDQVINLTEYRAKLFEYLQHRMNAIAPNLTVMVGELVGARLIARAGSLLNLAKQPASTVQILGAEKALFRALKTKHETPKYGLLYHASLVGQAAPKHKGKISRVLAAKTALAVRVDALGESSEPTIAIEGRAKVEQRMRQLQGGARVVMSGGAAARQRNADVAPRSNGAQYSTSADVAMVGAGAGAGAGASGNAAATPKSAKKAKKAKKDKKDKKKRSREEQTAADDDEPATPAKEAKRRRVETPAPASATKTPKTDKKKKKKKDKKKKKSA